MLFLLLSAKYEAILVIPRKKWEPAARIPLRAFLERVVSKRSPKRRHYRDERDYQMSIVDAIKEEEEGGEAQSVSQATAAARSRGDAAPNKGYQVPPSSFLAFSFLLPSFR